MQGGRELDMGGTVIGYWRLEIGIVAAFLYLLSTIHDLISLHIG
jgi:hypothetical protein